VSAGDRNQYIKLQKRADASVDGHGHAAAAWTDVTSLWARARPLRGREYFAAGQTQAEVDVVFEINFRTDVLPTWRVVWRTQPYDIVSPPIDPYGRREKLELMCRTGERDGR
jgi:SPP1 family predicted phage head-tail adaptor